MIEQNLLEHLRKISEEERLLLEGEKNVQKSLYTNEPDFVVDSRKMLAWGKLIDIRPHTRFVHFPAHKHNYIEMTGSLVYKLFWTFFSPSSNNLSSSEISLKCSKRFCSIIASLLIDNKFF